MHVEVRFRGHIDRDWANRLYGLQITHTSEGNTLLSGLLRDQAALQGLLSQLFKMGVQITSVSSYIPAPNKTEQEI